MNNQGKTDKQYNDSVKVVGYSIICMIILMTFLTLSTGCTTTKECCNHSNEIIEHYEKTSTK
tara:strand:- start:1711 stop:1896 length:186 start_codon:yes stop_codon:yes gene_type:complete